MKILLFFSARNGQEWCNMTKSSPDELSLSHMVCYQVSKIVAAVSIYLCTMVVQMMKVTQLLSLLTALYDL